MTKRKAWILGIVLAALALGLLLWRIWPKKFTPEPVAAPWSQSIDSITVAVDNEHSYRYETPEKLDAICVQWDAMELETVLLAGAG